MEHIRVAKGLGSQQIRDGGHLIVARNIVDGVTSLDAEVIAAGLQLVNDVGDVGPIIRLNIAQNEELLALRIGRVRGEGSKRTPDLPGAYLILIVRTGSQAGEGDAADVGRLVVAALDEGM